jgi:hypothetical protein
MKTVRLSVIALVLFVIVSCGGNTRSPSQPSNPTLASFTTGTWNLKVGLHGELTFYGSGVPITQSERGPLVPAQ